MDIKDIPRVPDAIEKDFTMRRSGLLRALTDGARCHAVHCFLQRTRTDVVAASGIAGGAAPAAAIASADSVHALHGGRATRVVATHYVDPALAYKPHHLLRRLQKRTSSSGRPIHQEKT
eukprot:352865-Chlamydomonas_euryale.AAC.6